MRAIFAVFLFLLVGIVSGQDGRLYSYYTAGGIKSGLVANNSKSFTLNGKPFVILSGEMHYFRTVKEHWRDRLLRLKAAGMNAVQFYVPWNVHEPTPGNYGGFEEIVDFLKMIKEADMFALFRPGPYICSEWDLGGLPSWLLNDPEMKLRSNYSSYIQAVGKYWNKLLPFVRNLTFTPSGGPIIAIQLENEYGYYGDTQVCHL